MLPGSSKHLSLRCQLQSPLSAAPQIGRAPSWHVTSNALSVQIGVFKSASTGRHTRPGNGSLIMHGSSSLAHPNRTANIWGSRCSRHSVQSCKGDQYEQMADSRFLPLLATAIGDTSPSSGTGSGSSTKSSYGPSRLINVWRHPCCTMGASMEWPAHAPETIPEPIHQVPEQ